MKRRLFPAVIFILLVLIPPAAAEVKTFAKEYTYQAGNLDNRSTARTIALEGVKERLWLDLWDHLEQNVSLKNLQLSPEQTGAFVPALASLRVTDEKWIDRAFQITAELTVDSDEIPRILKSLMKDSATTMDLIEIRKKREESLREMVLLKKAPPPRESRSKGKASARYAALTRQLTTAHWMLQGFHAEIYRDWKDAKGSFDQALQRGGKNETALYHRGLASLRLGQNRQAVQDLSRAARLNPESSRTWYLRGVAHLQAHRDRSAIGDFSKAIETNDKYVPAYFQRGLALDRAGSREEAIRDLSKTIELDPDDAQAYLNRGALFSKMGRKEEAARDLARAVRLDQRQDLTAGLPDRPSAKSGYDAHAIKDLDAVITRDPRNADAYFKRGVAYDNLGNHQQALQDLNRAIELNPQNAAAYFMRGLVYGVIDVRYESINDIRISARLGYKPAQDYMNAMGSPW